MIFIPYIRRTGFKWILLENRTLFNWILYQTVEELGSTNFLILETQEIWFTLRSCQSVGKGETTELLIRVLKDVHEFLSAHEKKYDNCLIKLPNTEKKKPLQETWNWF